MQVTFDRLPEAVSLILDRLENVERLLKQKENNSEATKDQLMVIEQAAVFLHLSVPTIYGLVSKRKIPVIKKSRRLYFSTHGLNKWLLESKREAIL